MEWVLVSFLVVHWYSSLFMQSFFLHRYSAHRVFEMNKKWETVFYWLTYILQGSSYLNPRAYGYMHNEHHQYSDTKRDPHSPHFFTNAYSMMLHTKNRYYELVHSKDPRHHKNAIENKFIDKVGDSWLSRLMFGGLYSSVYIVVSPHPAWFLLLPIHFLMGPIHGAIVNWCGHKYGYRNYKGLNDRSVNTLPVDVLLLGELYQNNHHQNGKNPNFARKWWELDPTYPIMLCFHYLGIIRIKQKQKIDLDELISEIRTSTKHQLDGLAVRLQKNQSIATMLWKSKKLELQEFVSSIVDIETLSSRNLDNWCKYVSNREARDLFVAKFLEKSPYRLQKMKTWINSRRNSKKLCAYRLIENEAKTTSSLKQSEWELFLETISKKYRKSNHELKESMISTYRSIANRNKELRKKAEELAAGQTDLLTA